MNVIVAQHFDELEARLITSQAIRLYRVLRREITPTEGKIRIRADLKDDGLLELFEYVTESQGELRLQTYSFHWQDKNGDLVRRWDNAPHQPQLKTRDHQHFKDGTVQASAAAPDIMRFIDEVEQTIGE